MRFALIHQTPHARPLPPEATVWRTCLREVAFLDDATRSGALSDGDAYALLVEIVTGLRSPLIGETEVQAQFKQFLASLDSAHHAAVLKIGRRVLADAKVIRQRHLQGFGAHSYGRLTLRHVPDDAATVIVGAGALARDVIAALGSRPVLAQWTRGDKRGSLMQPNVVAASAVAEAQPTGAAIDARISAPVAIIVAAPASRDALDLVISTYPHVVTVIDLRSADERTPIAIATTVVTLEDLFADARQAGTPAAGHVDRARADIRLLGREYDRREELHPFGWDDLCA